MLLLCIIFFLLARQAGCIVSDFEVKVQEQTLFYCNTAQPAPSVINILQPRRRFNRRQANKIKISDTVIACVFLVCIMADTEVLT